MRVQMGMLYFRFADLPDPDGPFMFAYAAFCKACGGCRQREAWVVSSRAYVILQTLELTIRTARDYARRIS